MQRRGTTAGVTGRVKDGVTIAVIQGGTDIVDWTHFEKTRGELGPAFIRVLSYFHEDGVKSIQKIEDAMRRQSTVDLVIPAHTLKGEARQFGANPVATIAELIENTARMCIETKRFPDELVKDVVELRRLFDQTIELFDKATNPLISRPSQPTPGGFGRKVTNQGFGRL